MKWKTNISKEELTDYAQRRAYVENISATRGCTMNVIDPVYDF